MLGEIAETVFRVLKITVIVAVCLALMVAINSILSLIVNLVFSSIIGEIFAVMSMFMPFNAGAVFSAIGVVISAILTFLCAKKIFDLTSWSISSI